MSAAIEMAYGCHWSTPFAKWQSALQHLHSIELAAWVYRKELHRLSIEPHIIDHAVPGTTVIQHHGFLWEVIAQKASGIDVVYTAGYGLARCRGGPMFWADSIGLPSIMSGIRSFGHRLGIQCWTPAPLSLELAGSGRGIGDWTSGYSAEAAQNIDYES